jgi:hypothetical protein
VTDSGRTVFGGGGGGGLALNGGFSPLPHLYAWTEVGPVNTSVSGVVVMTAADWGGIDTSDDTTGGAITFNGADGSFTVTETGVYVINFLASKDGTTPGYLQVGGGTGWFGPSYTQEFEANENASAFLTVPFGAGAIFTPAVSKLTTDFDVTWMEIQVARII